MIVGKFNYSHLFRFINSPFRENNPFIKPIKTTEKKHQYEEPEDYDEGDMDEGVPNNKKTDFDFFKNLNDQYSSVFGHLIPFRTPAKKSFL